MIKPESGFIAEDKIENIDKVTKKDAMAILRSKFDELIDNPNLDNTSEEDVMHISDRDNKDGMVAPIEVVADVEEAKWRKTTLLSLDTKFSALVDEVADNPPTDANNFEKQNLDEAGVDLSGKYTPNTTFEVNGNKYETDDNGKIYKINDHLISNNKYSLDCKTYYTDDNGKIYRINNELLSNNEYEMNGYKYKTDELGRIMSAEGELRLRDPEYNRKMEKVRDYEGQEYRESDDEGHLIGHRFGGSDKLENLIPQDAKINQKDFKNFEAELERAVKDGKEVYVTIIPVYEGDSKRPSKIIVRYTIDGEEFERTFPNESNEEDTNNDE